MTDEQEKTDAPETQAETEPEQVKTVDEMTPLEKAVRLDAGMKVLVQGFDRTMTKIIEDLKLPAVFHFNLIMGVRKDATLEERAALKEVFGSKAPQADKPIKPKIITPHERKPLASI